MQSDFVKKTNIMHNFMFRIFKTKTKILFNLMFLLIIMEFNPSRKRELRNR